MSDTKMRKCTTCGNVLPDDAPQGLCPRCLGALNLTTETVVAEQASPGKEPPLTATELAPHFPQLEILECLGRGGMGVVYKARQKSLNRLVALKLLAPERVGDARFAERFAQEARALAALNHPNIVTVHDFGQAGGYYYLLMEFVGGVNLRQAMKRGRFTPDQALGIVPPVCEALQYAHDHGIVHRDIKPENLLLDKEGRVKIADFGIARMLGAGAEEPNGSPKQPTYPPGSPSRSLLAGTPQYMAPEQLDAPGKADHRVDIYSLGVVLYELLTGELPDRSLEPPSHKVRIDVRLDEVVLRALERTPELRYTQASELKTQVETIMSGVAERQVMENSARKPRGFRLELAALSPLPLHGILLLALLLFSTFAVPRFIAELATLNAPLPVLTRMVFGFSSFVSHSWWLVIWFVLTLDTLLCLGTFWLGGRRACRIYGAIVAAGLLLIGVTEVAIVTTALPSDTANQHNLASAEISPEAEQPQGDASPSPGSLAQKPQLRFLAWQSEDREPSKWRFWYPDGSAVDDPGELRWIAKLHPVRLNLSGIATADKQPPVLSTWFTHPLFDDRSVQRVILLDESGAELLQTRGCSWAVWSKAPAAEIGNLGWLHYAVSLTNNHQLPPTIGIRLVYCVGPWVEAREFGPDFQGGEALENGVIVGTVGQSAKARAFISLSRADVEQPALRHDFHVTTRDGQDLAPSSVSGRGANQEVIIETFEFGVPLDRVTKFRLRTRAVQRIEFNNVSLERP